MPAKNWIKAAIVWGLLPWVQVVSVMPTGAAQVWLEAARDRVQLGDTLSVEVWVDATEENLTSAGVFLSFDPRVWQPVDRARVFEPGPFLDGGIYRNGGEAVEDGQLDYVAVAGPGGGGARPSAGGKGILARLRLFSVGPAAPAEGVIFIDGGRRRPVYTVTESPGRSLELWRPQPDLALEVVPEGIVPVAPLVLRQGQALMVDLKPQYMSRIWGVDQIVWQAFSEAPDLLQVEVEAGILHVTAQELAGLGTVRYTALDPAGGQHQALLQVEVLERQGGTGVDSGIGSGGTTGEPVDGVIDSAAVENPLPIDSPGLSPRLQVPTRMDLQVGVSQRVDLSGWVVDGDSKPETLEWSVEGQGPFSVVLDGIFLVLHGLGPGSGRIDLRVRDEQGNRAAAAWAVDVGGDATDVSTAVVAVDGHRSPTALVFPNPFNAAVKFQFDLPHAAWTRLQIMAANGQVVRLIEGGWRAAGPWTTRWDGRDGAGRDVASGVYLYVLENGEWRRRGKLGLLR
jgi:hypothetical protein